MRREFAAVLATTNAQWTITKNVVTQVGVRIGSVLLPAYTVADLTVQKDLGRGLQWFGRVENLGSVRYQTARGYTQAPRGLFTGLRWALGS